MQFNNFPVGLSIRLSVPLSFYQVTTLGTKYNKTELKPLRIRDFILSELKQLYGLFQLTKDYLCPFSGERAATMLLFFGPGPCPFDNKK